MDTDARSRVTRSRIDFRSVYEWFDGTVWAEYDCGLELCKTAKCCGGVREEGQQPHIFLLPGELVFLQENLGHKLPLGEVGTEGRFHCSGNSACIYGMRPIDCRTYPLWPSVGEQGMLGLLDCRGSRCPIELIPEPFIERIRRNWMVLFREYPWLLDWFREEFGITVPEIATQEE